MNAEATQVEGTPHVLVVGGGFGGLNVVRALARAPVRVTLLDRKNHHLFQPLLYQVATAGLSPADIAEPIRRILRHQRNVTVQMGEVDRVDLEQKSVVLGSGDVLAYDHLVLACGATHSWFGHDEWARHAMGLKSLEDALQIRRRILLAFEMAEVEADPKRRRALLTFVVIGGGPTGVELAGAIAEIARRTLARDFRNIDPSSAKVHLIEAGDRILAAFDPSLSAAAQDALSTIGVAVSLRARVTRIDDAVVHLGDRTIHAQTILWAAGVAGSPLAATLGVPLDRAGRVIVGKDCAIEGHPEVYVIGDMASCVDAVGCTVPGLCQGAIQMGHVAADNIVRAVAGVPGRAEIRYKDLGTMATVGRAHAIVELGFVKFSGFFAWLTWSLLHVALLIGFDNRLVVMLEWFWSWATFDRGARLITHEIPVLAPPLETQPVQSVRSAVDGEGRHAPESTAVGG